MCNKTNLKEYTKDDVEKHVSEDDCWLVIGNSSNGGSKVYDVTKYLDDHPGGAEVMLDVAGKDADEFFEDIGHSKEARSELEKYLIGTYKESEEELRQKALALEQKKSSTGNSSFMIVLVALIAALVYFKMNN